MVINLEAITYTPVLWLCVPVLTSLLFFGLMGAVEGSAASFSLPFLRIGLRDGVLLREGRVA